MGDMKDEDRRLLHEIHDHLIGGLDRQGFIGETKEKIARLDIRMSQLEKYKKGSVGLAASVILIFVTQLAQYIF